MKRQRSSASPSLPFTRGEYPPLIVIGASAGGPSALQTLLTSLRTRLNAPCVIVQHFDYTIVGELMQWLSSFSPYPIAFAEHGITPQIGTIYLPQKNEHLLVNNQGQFEYTTEPRDLPYVPSIDIFFSAVAFYWRGHVAGALLTGMGEDGVLGLQELRDRGHRTFAQDEATSSIYGMPKAAMKRGAAQYELPLDQILPAAVNYLRSKRDDALH